MTRIPRYSAFPTWQRSINMQYLLLSILFLGFVVSDNITFESSSDITISKNSFNTELTNQNISWGEWSPCTRSCGGGLSRQQKKCRKKCKGRTWTFKYKLCNTQLCEDFSDFRAQQCSAYDGVPYSDQMLKWSPHYDSTKLCSLICRGEQMLQDGMRDRKTRLPEESKRIAIPVEDDIQDFELDETIVVQLAEKVEDGTRCRPEGLDVCIDGECMKVGCDLKVGSNKKVDACGVCGGNGSACYTKYAWVLEPASSCSESCGVGFKIAMPVCKTIDGSLTDNTNCDLDSRPDKILLPCNTHPCTTKWITEEWSRCSASCGGGFRTRSVFCTEENGNATSTLPDYKCSVAHKPHYQETCNTISCPMWETSQWSDCTVSCGTGIRTRTIECRDGIGQMSNECDLAESPHAEKECKTNVPCPHYEEMAAQPLVQSYPAPPIPEKLIDQPIPSESTYIAEEWSPCSVTCGTGIRRREVHCKIFLEFSRTIAKLPDRQCSGPKPIEAENCTMKPCDLVENSLSYRIDTVGDSGYAESSMSDTYRSFSSFSGPGNYESNIKVAPGVGGRTTYSWKEMGYTDCSATCLGGVQDLIITCVRDDNGKPTSPYQCSPETKPESRIKTCNDYPCPPRWNTSDFSPCMSPCGLGIQTRDVICIHEVTRGITNTVVVPNHMCPQPPPVDRQYCNVWDCPVKWQIGKWSKCSKSCGGGVKTRPVTCEQVMAQGRKQQRPERDCPSHKPTSKKSCNTMPCSELGTNARPIILSQNSTFTQEDPNRKVDLEIGGTAIIFQGTTVVKIRCPVKNFDKSQIVWMKDRMELRKSRKYKISEKGALRIKDITQLDKGLYSCVADQTQAEMQIVVKPRPADQMSNEEVLRSGNTVHHRQGSSFNPGRFDSDESLHPDQAAPAYGTLAFDSDTIQSRQDGYETRKRQEKPRKRKQRPNATSPNSTKPNGEYITSHHQPGYHESTAASSASTLVPHISLLISTLKSYLPFYGTSSSSESHRTSPQMLSEATYYEDKTTTQSMPQTEDNFHYGNRMDYNFMQRNTAIPDETFGPDEERIFIDDDAYDMDDAIFILNHKSRPKITPEVVSVMKAATTPTISVIDFSFGKPTVHRSHDSRHFYRNQRGTGPWDPQQKKELTQTDQPGSDAFYVNNAEKDRKEAVATTSMMKGDDSRENIRVEDRVQSTLDFTSTTSTFWEPEEIKESSDTEAKSTPIVNELGYEFNSEENNESTSDGLQITNSSQETIETWPTDNSEKEESKEEEELEVLRRSSNSDSKPDTLATNDNFDEFTHSTRFTVDASKTSKALKTSVILGESNSTTPENNFSGPTIGPVVTFSKVAKDDLIFEWVTTEWSRCSQTCGGGGFQMRGAQCTVRSAKPSVNSTRTSPRTVIGATLCEDAGYPVPQKVRPCGTGRCPQWHTSEWTSCETSRCFNWKIAMQRREITCRLVEEKENGTEISTTIDSSKCDDSTRPPQRQECYNDACKGVWRAGEWSECTAPCEEDGIKYRILQCVWFGTKKPAGNACRDIPRPPVMKTCRGPPCPRSPDECKDHSQLCNRVKIMNMCRVPLYQKKCCKSCR